MKLPALLLITDRRRTPRPLIEAVRLALSALPPGAAGILLREKDLAGGPLLALARELRALTREHGSALIINGRLDVAIAAEADAVHLGGDAPPYESVRALAPSTLGIGVSLHGDELPPASATYALLSPVFKASTKPGVRPLGVTVLRARCAIASATPIFALGGVDASNAGQCLRAGAAGVASLAGVLAAPDPGEAARRLHAALVAAGSPRRKKAPRITS